MTQLTKQKTQIKQLNARYQRYWQKEFGGRNTNYISNPKNFTEKTYFHQANSPEDKLNIVRFGFNQDLVSEENRGRGLGAGLYMGRDKAALMNFYSDNFNKPADNILTISGEFRFFDAIGQQVPKRNVQNFVLRNGYDGIRYYDKDATGEEFVLFRYKNISFSIC